MNTKEMIYLLVLLKNYLPEISRKNIEVAKNLGIESFLLMKKIRDKII